MVGIWGFKNERLINVTGEFFISKDCNKSKRNESIFKEEWYEKINLVISNNYHADALC